jgi:ABC-type proline/glycine betaine transport system permease subunit
MKLTKQRIKEIIKEELEGMNEEPAEVPVEESMMMDAAQMVFDPETIKNMGILMEAAKKFATDPFSGTFLAAVIATGTIGAAYEEYQEAKAKAQGKEAKGQEEGGGM